MVARKTIGIREDSHAALREFKHENRLESFDAALRELLAEAETDVSVK